MIEDATVEVLSENPDWEVYHDKVQNISDLLGSDTFGIGYKGSGTLVAISGGAGTSVLFNRYGDVAVYDTLNVGTGVGFSSSGEIELLHSDTTDLYLFAGSGVNVGASAGYFVGGSQSATFGYNNDSILYSESIGIGLGLDVSAGYSYSRPLLYIKDKEKVIYREGEIKLRMNSLYPNYVNLLGN